MFELFAALPNEFDCINGRIAQCPIFLPQLAEIFQSLQCRFSYFLLGFRSTTSH